MRKFYLMAIFILIIISSSAFAITCDEIWYPGFNYRKNITLNSSQIRADLINFTVLISITDSNLTTSAQSNGNDILFTDCDGLTKLNHEIDYYSSGNLIAWVNIPNITNTSNQIIYMYYGNSTVTTQSNKSGTWNKNYMGVFHFGNGTNLNTNDSTRYGNNGTANGGVLNLTGQIGGAASFDGVDDYIEMTTLGFDSNPVTFDVWIYKKTMLPDIWGRVIVSPYLTYQNLASIALPGEISANANYNSTIVDCGNTSTTRQTPTNSLIPNTWNHVVLTCINTVPISVYINGQNQTLTTPTLGFGYPNGGNFRVGLRADATRGANATVDELKISNVSYSQAWIQTEYNNQVSPSSFTKLGNEQAYSSCYPIPGANWNLNAADNCTISGKNLDIINWIITANTSGKVTIFNSNITYYNKTYSVTNGFVDLIINSNTRLIAKK